MGKKRISDKDASALIAKLEGIHTPGDFVIAWEHGHGNTDYVFSSYVFVADYNKLPDIFEIKTMTDFPRYTDIITRSDVKKAEVLCTAATIELLTMVLYTNSEETEGGFELDVLNKLCESLAKRRNHAIDSIMGVLGENEVPPTNTLCDTIEDILLVLSGNDIDPDTDPEPDTCSA